MLLWEALLDLCLPLSVCNDSSVMVTSSSTPSHFGSSSRGHVLLLSLQVGIHEDVFIVTTGSFAIIGSHCTHHWEIGHILFLFLLIP